MEAKARVYTLSNKEARAKFETLGDTPGDEETMALAAILAVSLRESIAGTRGHEQGDVGAKALVLMVVNMGKDPETKTLRDKLEDVEAKALFDSLADTIAEGDSVTLPKHYAM